MSIDEGTTVSTLSPHDHLPIEVMSKIFVDVCHETSYGFRLQNRIQSLSAVCKAWRSIVLSTPELHPKYVLKVTNRRISQEELVKVVGLAKEWFDRSGILPCDLNVQVAGMLKFAQLAMELTPLLVDIGERLRTLQLRGTRAEVNPILVVLPQNLASLETLYIRKTVVDEAGAVLPSFANCGKLTTVTLYDALEHNTDLKRLLPYSQLTSLTIRDLHLKSKAIQHILLSAINLINCTLIHPFRWRAENPSIRNPFNPHRFLQKFHFTWSFPTIFSALCLPTLKELEMDQMERYTTLDVTGMLLQLYHRAPFRLEILKLSDCFLNVEEFSHFLRLVPDLRVLHLPRCRIDDERLLNLLTIASPSTTGDSDTPGGEEGSLASQHTSLLPNLEYLNLAIPAVQSKASKESIVAFVESRLKPYAVPLKRLVVVHIPGLEPRVSSFNVQRSTPMSIENHAIVISYLSPHLYLPTEIMSKVFMLICHDKKHTEDVAVRILCLSQVCRAWHAIVLSTPELYSNYALSIDYCGISQRGLDATVQRAKEWFERSVSHPCDLYFTITGPLFNADITSSMTPLVESIRGRLRNLRLRGVQRDFNHVLQLFSGEFPLLEWLCIRRRGGDNVPFISSPSFVQCKRLKSVDLYDVFVDGLELTNFLPYSQLTSIIIQDRWITSGAIYHILRSSTKLVECRIVNSSLRVQEDLVADQLYQVLLLPSLHRLSISCSFPAIFAALHLPALRVLELWNERRGHELDIPALTGLYDRASFQLETLRIHGGALDVRDFAEFLALVPGLRGLHLSGCQVWGGDLFSALTLSTLSAVEPESQQKILLPELRHFSTALYRYTPPDDIITFVESRLELASTAPGHTSRLESFALRTCDYPLNFGIGPIRLKKWEEKGLIVRIR
ncbi:hypothetical protein BDN72DRAFT_898469 [Pluteus cervinus]|uniref:Uncharacterized protein n=1 Tax=Pluteus cervinus TaxID=181527 RepID=A0ACD3AQ05_9AGAR|nr:hypothetical protein BDN72DRAFT_898469 [Pluteus cervinus]